MHSIRDNNLLDALEKLKQEPYEGTVWRSVRSGNRADECWKSGGRWDDRSFDVLYTSTTREAAIEERRFHLFRGQPIPPSRIIYELFELKVSLSSTITFGSLEDLNAVGLDTSNYGQASYPDRETEYPRTQQIAEACMFLGADGILVPSARHTSLNLVVFCEQNTNPEFEVVANHGAIKW